LDKEGFKKMLNKDKKNLRFSASIVSKRSEDKGRKFVVSYFLSDDTVAIYESPRRNSGFRGGKFLERRQATKPGSKDTYKVVDFYVGAVIDVYNTKFLLEDADDYALGYMESEPQMFSYSDVDQITKKIQGILKDRKLDLGAGFKAFDSDGSGYISLAEFRDAIIGMELGLAEQEIYTLMRRYDLDDDGKISYEEFVAAFK
jgi:EF-hand domain-containing protein 1